ncbi:RNA-dependent RNA polymerase [Theobroma cacao]|nr:RNA-dependent RNA polymerase [Theobroma cacao]
MDLELATLHYMAVDFAKTGALAKMPRSLKPREFSDFMQRVDKPMYASLEDPTWQLSQVPSNLYYLVRQPQGQISQRNKILKSKGLTLGILDFQMLGKTNLNHDQSTNHGLTSSYVYKPNVILTKCSSTARALPMAYF